MRTETGQLIRLEDYRPSDFTIETVDLTFQLGRDDTLVTSRLTMQRRNGVSADAPLVLDGDELSLVSVSVSGVAVVPAVVRADRLELISLPAGDKFELEIITRVNPAANKQLMGLYATNGNFCTQCEAEGFRRITYFLDRPDVLAVYTVRIEADKAGVPLLLSNGNKIDSGALPQGRHFAVWHDPFPKPSYLFALFAGDLGVITDKFVTMTGRDVALEIYVEHGKEARATYAMDALKRSMKWDEEVFGREYDLDIFMIVAVSDFNMGAMENKGLNVFNDKYVLADPQTATDQDYANIEAIIAHEYFHNWTGNRITCRDWFQLCLKEGLTVFRDHEFSADMRSRGVKRVQEVRLLRAHQFPEDGGPLAHPVRPRKYKEINNFYTATVYEKGSEVVRMLATVLGREGFKAGMDLYFERHDGDAATIEDFLACFAEATGTDLSQFALWYDQPGTPNVAVTTSHDAAKAQFTVELTQKLKPPVKNAPHAPMHIPVRFGLVGHDGHDMAWESVTGGDVVGDVMHLTNARQTFTFTGVAARPVLSAFRGFSAPVTLVPEPADDDLAFLARHDSDGFNRWQALNTLLMRQLRNAVQADTDQPVDPQTLIVMGEIAGNDAMEPAYRAMCLTLPSEADVAREIGANIDPDRIHAAVKKVSLAVADHSAATLRHIYDSMGNDGAYSPEAEAAGRRTLANVALGYLCLAEDDIGRAAKQFAAADNMTDMAHALSVMAHQAPDDKRSGDALNSFKQQFGADPIVMDKWYIVQATIPGDGALARVKALTTTSGFSFENPNRTRALIGGFATGNNTGFNRLDGEGYRYLVEVVKTIDAFNPQVAARLITAMRSWRTLEPVRRAHALAALSDLAASEHLSRDVRDIVERTLA